MGIDKDLLEIICCPDTHQDLRVISDRQLGLLNDVQKLESLLIVREILSLIICLAV